MPAPPRRGLITSVCLHRRVCLCHALLQSEEDLPLAGACMPALPQHVLHHGALPQHVLACLPCLSMCCTTVPCLSMCLHACPASACAAPR